MPWKKFKIVDFLLQKSPTKQTILQKETYNLTVGLTFLVRDAMKEILKSQLTTKMYYAEWVQSWFFEKFTPVVFAMPW